MPELNVARPGLNFVCENILFKGKYYNFAAIMANPLKQLAGETAIYGLSTILARVINFLFVPFYTRLLTTESYGVVTEFMAYIAVLQVALVLGLETGCFRFANKDGVNPDSVYSNALSAVFGVSAAFLAAMIVFAGPMRTGACRRADSRRGSPRP